MDPATGILVVPKLANNSTKPETGGQQQAQQPYPLTIPSPYPGYEYVHQEALYQVPCGWAAQLPQSPPPVQQRAPQQTNKYQYFLERKQIPPVPSNQGAQPVPQAQHYIIEQPATDLLLLGNAQPQMTEQLVPRSGYLPPRSPVPVLRANEYNNNNLVQTRVANYFEENYRRYAMLPNGQPQNYTPIEYRQQQQPMAPMPDNGLYAYRKTAMIDPQMQLPPNQFMVGKGPVQYAPATNPYLSLPANPYSPGQGQYARPQYQYNTPMFADGQPQPQPAPPAVQHNYPIAPVHENMPVQHRPIMNDEQWRMGNQEQGKPLSPIGDKDLATSENIDALRKEVAEIKALLKAQNTRQIADKVDELMINFNKMKAMYVKTLKELTRDDHFKSQIGDSESAIGQNMSNIKKEFKGITSQVSIVFQTVSQTLIVL